MYVKKAHLHGYFICLKNPFSPNNRANIALFSEYIYLHIRVGWGESWHLYKMITQNTLRVEENKMFLFNINF